jgi:hypothetical protein
LELFFILEFHVHFSDICFAGQCALAAEQCACKSYTRTVVEKEKGTVPAAAMLSAWLGDSSVDGTLVMLH